MKKIINFIVAILIVGTVNAQWSFKTVSNGFDGNYLLYEVPQASNPKYSHCCKKTAATASCVQVGVNENILNKISFKHSGKTYQNLFCAVLKIHVLYCIHE